MPQALSTALHGQTIRIHQSGPRVIAEGYYRVGYKLKDPEVRVKLHPLVWIDGAFRIDPNRQPFFRDGSTLVELDS